MSLALDPSIGTFWSQHYVEVETSSELTVGMTVVDRLNVAANPRNRAVWAPLLEKGPNAKVCWSIDVQRWKEALCAAVR
jgi:purine nucleosidase